MRKAPQWATRLGETMLTQQAKDLFYELDFEFQPIAIKYCYSQPEGFERVDEELSFCEFPKKAAVEDRAFFVIAEDDNCFGKMIMGMVEKPGLAASGQAGKDFGVFRTQAANARLYHNITTLSPGAVNFVAFCPLHLCDFEPDLVFCVADMRQADILMRATSYISGDLWQSTASCVLSCSWLFGYPYVSGKVNYTISGLGHGMRRRKVYPSGRMLISIPFAKLSEVIEALGQMDWDLIAMKEDEKSKAELRARMDKWQEMSPDFTLKK